MSKWAENLLDKHIIRLSSHYLQNLSIFTNKKVLFLKKLCGILVFETLKNKKKYFLNSNTCFCLRLYGSLIWSPRVSWQRKIKIWTGEKKKFSLVVLKMYKVCSLKNQQISIFSTTLNIFPQIQILIFLRQATQSDNMY